MFVAGLVARGFDPRHVQIDKRRKADMRDRGVNVRGKYTYQKKKDTATSTILLVSS